MIESESLSLLEGAVDLHCHTYPEYSLSFPAGMDDIEALELARDYGMAGIVFKSHMFPTFGQAYYLQKCVPEVSVYSSIVLNTICGGFDPMVVEHSIKMGAKVIYMPTWSAKKDREMGWAVNDLKEWVPSTPLDVSLGLTVLNEDGTVRNEVVEILEMARDNGLITITGHLSPEECLKLFEKANALNYHKIVWCHALSFDVSDEDLEKAVSLGAYIDLNCISLLGHFRSADPKRYFEVISNLGPDHIVLTSDRFHESCPHPAEMIRILVEKLLKAGFKGDDIRKMIVKNQSELLDIKKC